MKTDKKAKTKTNNYGINTPQPPFICGSQLRRLWGAEPTLPQGGVASSQSWISRHINPVLLTTDLSVHM